MRTIRELEASLTREAMDIFHDKVYAELARLVRPEDGDFCPLTNVLARYTLVYFPLESGGSSVSYGVFRLPEAGYGNECDGNVIGPFESFAEALRFAAYENATSSESDREAAALPNEANYLASLDYAAYLVADAAGLDREPIGIVPPSREDGIRTRVRRLIYKAAELAYAAPPDLKDALTEVNAAVKAKLGDGSFPPEYRAYDEGPDGRRTYLASTRTEAELVAVLDDRIRRLEASDGGDTADTTVVIRPDGTEAIYAGPGIPLEAIPK